MPSELYDTEQPPSQESGITLEQAREAYVQRNYILYEEHFKAFDEAGGFRFSFCWPVFFAGMLWFLYRKMYIESLGIFVIGLIVGGVSGILGPPGGSGGLAFSFCMSVIMALSARWFYWKAVDRKVERAWEESAGRPQVALEWLRVKGGVNPGLVAAILFGVLLFLYSVSPQ